MALTRAGFVLRTHLHSQLYFLKPPADATRRQAMLPGKPQIPQEGTPKAGLDQARDEGAQSSLVSRLPSVSSAVSPPSSGSNPERAVIWEDETTAVNAARPFSTAQI